MPRIAELNVYPVKSCRGIALRESMLLETGLEHDRRWMVVDEAGKFVTQREYPRMSLIETSIGFDRLMLKAPGMLRLELPLEVIEDAPEAVRTVQVWGDHVEAIDEGHVSATWLSAFLGKPARLVKFHPDARRRCDRAWTGAHDAAVGFADAYPLLVLSQASLDDLNARLARKGLDAVPMNRFRPNIVVDGVPAHEEDHIDTMAVAGALFKLVKPCTRCSIPSVDQVTGRQLNEPGDTLATYRSDPKVGGGITFGQNAIVIAGAGTLLRVGDELSATLNF